MSSGKATVTDLPRTRVELHVHLDGAVRHETIWELAKQKGIKLPGNGSFHDLRKALIIRDPINLQHFLKPFLIFTPCFTGDMKAIERAAYEFCEDEAQNGVIYVEARYSPHFWLSSEDKRGQIEELSEVVRAVNRGFERGENDFGVKAQSILCALNGTHTVRDVFELCKKFKGEGVVGLDLAMNSMDKSEKYVEVPLNPEEIAVYEEARKCGIHRTLHAGEAGGPEMVQRAMNNYQTERVGHGYHVVQDENIYQACLQNNIHFEACPWSSFLTGAVPLNTPKHPIVRFAEDNANFSLNTDDPTITGHSLNEDYALTSTWGLNEVHVIRATLNAARSSFLPEEERKKLVKRILKVYSIEE